MSKRKVSDAVAPETKRPKLREPLIVDQSASLNADTSLHLSIQAERLAEHREHISKRKKSRLPETNLVIDSYDRQSFIKTAKTVAELGLGASTTPICETSSSALEFEQAQIYSPKWIRKSTMPRKMPS